MSELVTAVNVTKLNVKMYDCGRGRVFRSVENSSWRGNGRSTWLYRKAGNYAEKEKQTFLNGVKGRGIT